MAGSGAGVGGGAGEVKRNDFLGGSTAVGESGRPGINWSLLLLWWCGWKGEGSGWLLCERMCES